MVHPMTIKNSELPMLERVARVLAGGDGANWFVHVERARAILLAMRTPTTEMLEAARPGLPFTDDLADDWDAMLGRAALDPVADWQLERKAG
jgi:hypothetical protein